MNTTDENLIALKSGLESLEKRIAELAIPQDALYHAKSVLLDENYWASFPKRFGDGTFELAEPYRLKFLAQHHSAKLLCLQLVDAVSASASCLMTGPVADCRRKLKCEHGYMVDDMAPNLVTRAMQVAQKALRDTKQLSDYLRKERFANEAVAAMETLKVQIFNQYINVDLSTFMQFIPTDSKLAGYPTADQVNQVKAALEETGRLFSRMKGSKGHLNEDTYGHRLEKAKGKARTALKAQQASLRCHLVWRLAEVEASIWKAVDSNLFDTRNVLIAAVAGSPMGSDERALNLSNLLAVEALLSSINDWRGYIRKELRDHEDVYKIAREAAIEVFEGKEPAPEVFNIGIYVM